MNRTVIKGRGKYAAAVRAERSGLLEISGLAAYDGSGHEVFPGDLLSQTRYVLSELMEPILKEAGAGIDTMCRLSVFTTDIRQWPGVWDQIQPEIGAPPAMTVVEIPSLVGSIAMVELEITAATNGESQVREEVRGMDQGAVAVLPSSLAGRDWELHAAAFQLGQGDLIFLSGLGPTDGDGNTIGAGDAGAQTRQIISSISAILREAGGSLDDVIRVRVFATDMKNRPAINAERMKAFKKPRAVSTFVQVSGLEEPDWLVAIEATAFVPKLDR